MKYLLTGKKSQRLKYRPIQETDFEQFLPFFLIKEAIQYYPFPETATPESLCREWFDRQYKRYENDLGGFNALIEIQTDRMIGHCGLLVQEIDGISELEVGYALLPEFWGKGFATEAAQFCKAMAFKNEWADKLISIIVHANTPSIRVAERNGMVYEKDSVFKDLEVGIWRANQLNQ